MDNRLLNILGFFSPAVLAAYREQPDKYLITTDHFEGRVTVKVRTSLSWTNQRRTASTSTSNSGIAR